MKRLPSTLLFLVMIIFPLTLLNACAAPATQVSPTTDPNQISTAAVQTYQAHISQTAASQATPTLGSAATTEDAKTTPVETTPTPGPIDPTTTAVIHPAPDDKATLLDQSPNDNSQVGIGQKFEAVWSVKNVGKTAWTKTYLIRYFAGAALGETYTYKFKKDVPPGEEINLTVDMVAPNYTGTFTTRWVLTNDQGQNFYDVFLTVKVIKGKTPTPTRTPNLTPSATIGGG